MTSFFQLSDARELLRTWREDVVRRSEDIVSIWEEILCDTQSDLGDERWMILEQVRLIQGMHTHKKRETKKLL